MSKLYDKVLIQSNFKDKDIYNWLKTTIDDIYPANRQIARVTLAGLFDIIPYFYNIAKEDIDWKWLCQTRKKIKDNPINNHCRVDSILIRFFEESDSFDRLNEEPKKIITSVWNSIKGYQSELRQFDKHKAKILFNEENIDKLYYREIKSDFFIISININDEELKKYTLQAAISHDYKCSNERIQFFVDTITSLNLDLNDYETLFNVSFFKLIEYFKDNSGSIVTLRYYINSVCNFYTLLLTNKQEYQEYIEQDEFSIFRDLLENPQDARTFFCHNYESKENTYLCNERKGGTSLHTINFKNKEIQKLFAIWYQRCNKAQEFSYRNVLQSCFEDSLGEYANNIKSYKDFNGKTLFHQINYIKQERKVACYKTIQSLSYVILSFYRYLVSTYEDYDFFQTDTNITRKVLFSPQTILFIEQNYEYKAYNPYDEAPTAEKIVFIFLDNTPSSSKLSTSNTLSVNLSNIENIQYRKWIYEYLLSSPQVIPQIPHYTICKILPKLLSAKKEKNYPNPDDYYFTNQEAVFIRSLIDSEDKTIAAKNNDIGKIRRFFQWLENSNYVRFDDIFFEYLKQYEEPKKSKAKPIPNNDLIKLNDALLEKGKTSDYWFAIFAIFHLLIQTEFRTRTITNLKINNIMPSFKPNEYILRTTEKTSHGENDNYVITATTYNLLQEVINRTESLRNEYILPDIKDNIFIYNSKLSVRKFDTSKVSNSISEVCDEINIPRYTAVNLRYTHMTKALEHVIRNKKSDAELALLTKHKHIDTTKNHYVELELEQMLESTYGIIIGDVPYYVEKNIVNNVPEEHKNDIVESGCGNCTAEYCLIKNSLPCLMCDSFITTIKHEPFFIKAIEHINELISKSQLPHDRDDLISIKRLYVAYLKEIYKKKESI